MSADGTSDDPWVLHIILASAECGLATPIEESLAQPTATNFPALTGGLLSHRAAASPASEKVIDEKVIDETVVETVDQADTGQIGADQADADQAGPDAGARENAVAAELDDSAVGAARSEVDDSTIGPQEPEIIALGRWFTVTSRDGVELGSVKIDDIVRSPGCGVELTLSITTSAEAGPDRWSSIGPGDFAELRSSGATRDARTVSSDCQQPAASTTTRLSPDREYEIVLAFHLDDSAQRAMLRPDGTAGWAFDLPPLPKVAVVATTGAPVPAAVQSPATSTAAASAPATVAQTVESDA